MEYEQKPKKRGRPSAKQEEVKKPQAQKLVKMTRDGKSADVHPAEVEHMKSHGWAEQ